MDRELLVNEQPAASVLAATATTNAEWIFTGRSLVALLTGSTT
jgi:hypothetical protein